MKSGSELFRPGALQPTPFDSSHTLAFASTSSTGRCPDSWQPNRAGDPDCCRRWGARIAEQFLPPASLYEENPPVRRPWRAHSNRRAQPKFRAVRESFSRYFNPLHWNLHSISVSLVSFNSAQAQALFAWRVATSHSTTAPAIGNPIYGQYTNRVSSF